MPLRRVASRIATVRRWNDRQRVWTEVRRENQKCDESERTLDFHNTECQKTLANVSRLKFPNARSVAGIGDPGRDQNSSLAV